MNMFSNGTRSTIIHNNIVQHNIKSFHNSTTIQESLLSEKFATLIENSCMNITYLKQLHASIFCNGFGNSIFLGSKLLNCYAKFGSLPESRQVFNGIINDNLSLWNSVLVGYFKSGHFHEVLCRYSCLRSRNIGLDSCGITFCIKSCVDLGWFRLGTSIHGDCVKFGFYTDGFVGTSLIGLYAKNGVIDDAHKVFDQIIDRDIVVYTSLITGYAQIHDRRAYKAFKIARDMQIDDLDPNRVTLVGLLQASAQVKAFEEGRSIHGYAIKRDIGCSDEVFQTSLMDMYAKCGSPEMLFTIFAKMSVKTVGSWNAVINGFLQTGQPLKALDLLRIMMKELETRVPDLITLANTVLCCANLEYLREGKSIHGYLIRIGFRLDLVTITSLIDMYAKCNKLIIAKRLFNLTEDKDVISFNVMIAGYLLNASYVRDAIKVFHEMIEACIKPNLGTVLSLFSISCYLRDVKQGKSIHGYVFKHGYDLNTEIFNQIMYMYGKCGCMDYAKKAFIRMNYKDVVTWTSMMMCYVSHGHGDEAMAIFKLMQREKLEVEVEVDSITLITLLQALAQVGCVSFAKEVHAYVYRFLMEREITVINSLITTYAKCGKIKTARDLFEKIIKKKCPTSWNAIISAYGIHGDCYEIFELFESMKKENVLPDEVTFTSLLSACSHSGLIEEGLNIFRLMKEEHFINPSEEHYKCVVDMLSRAGRVEEAYNLLKRFGINENASALSSLLGACRVHGNFEMGELIGKMLLDIEPKKSSNYALVSNLYAGDGKWDHVARIRGIPESRGLKWSHGYSLIELDKQANVK